MAKKCSCCGKLKPIADYQKRFASIDGLTASCRSCLSVRDKNRANAPHRIEARKIYAKTADGIKASNAAKQKWTIKNSDRKAASQMVCNAVRDGRLIREPCSVCGSEYRIHGHHEDYSKPLKVIWLCPQHHRDIHSRIY